MPLILSRKVGETVSVDGPCEIRILWRHGGRIELEFTAPPGVNIRRGELQYPCGECGKLAKLNRAWLCPECGDLDEPTEEEKV